ncbi:energy-coupling factor transporter transmembrane component T family protein [Streptomyces sp. NPDC060194]|uniref:energy-coupling factor transporter transmembrane component T family protein n=1 Tax=Streptomyces sp. NPDC060194 TaxID=3347069 RepID=UPI0036559684
MSLFEPIVDSAAPLARRNPTAKLVAALVLSLTLVVSLDPVAPALALAVELALVPAFGLRYGELLRRTWPLLVSVAGAVFALVLFAQERTGAVLVDAGPLHVTTGVLATALALALRLVAVGLPGLMVVATTDPTDLADSLVQNARVPARFAFGALAALRMVPLLGEEWRMIALARRARGLDAGRNPVRGLRLLASAAFTLLVGAIRRGTRLAQAMDARGFDARTPRTYAREQRFLRADTAMVAGAVVVAAGCVVASVVTGTFNPVFGG